MCALVRACADDNPRAVRGPARCTSTECDPARVHSRRPAAHHCARARSASTRTGRSSRTRRSASLGPRSVSTSSGGFSGSQSTRLRLEPLHLPLLHVQQARGLCYQRGQYPVNRVSRFTLGDNDVVDPASENILFDNIPSPTGLHNSGDVQFGKDGNLYVTVGDGSCDFRLDSGCGPINDAAHDLSAPNGKVLRITSSGGIPPGNPFQGAGTQKCNVDGFAEPPTRCREIFASGLRNPWRLAFDPNAAGTSFYINDVGLSKWERSTSGPMAPTMAGMCAKALATRIRTPTAVQPRRARPIPSTRTRTTGCASIIGGIFAPVGKWTPDVDGAYLFGDLVCGKIFKLTPAGGGTYTTTEFATPIGTNWLISMIVGPHAGNDAIYYTPGTTETRRTRCAGSPSRDRRTGRRSPGDGEPDPRGPAAERQL